MELSVIIVNYNVKHFLEQALLSIQKAIQGIDTEIIVVDNASQDGSVAMLRQKFPTVKLILNTKNIGFAAANNFAIKQIQGKYVVFINPDTVVQEDTFRILISFFENHADAGMVGCKILNPDGTLQLACRRSFPTAWVALSRLTGLSKLFPGSRFFGRYNLTYLDPNKIYPVEAISGSFMMARNDVLQQVGYFDETWFMYGEDLDLCYRFGEAGWKIYYVPTTKIIHFKGESSKQSEFDTIRLFYQAMRLFVAKYYKSYFFQFLLEVGILLRAGLHYLNHILSVLTLPFIDLIFLNGALISALLIRFGNFQHLHSYFVVMVLYSLVWLGSLFSFSCYGRYRFSASRAALAVIAGLFVNTSLTFFFNQIAYSRIVVLVAGILDVILLFSWRLLFKMILKTYGWEVKGVVQNSIWGKRTLIIGTGQTVVKLIEKLEQRIDGGYEIIGMASFNSDDLGRQFKNIQVLGVVDNLSSIIKNQRIQDVIFSTDQINYDQIMEVMQQTRGLGVNYRLVPDNYEVIIGKSSIDDLGEIPLLEIDNQFDNPTVLLMKRGFDIFVALMILIVSSPILIYHRCLCRKKFVKFSIHGENNKMVDVWKFNKPIKQAFLRILPAFFSVLKGDISLVGAEMIPFSPESARFNVLPIKPGLTGLVQIAAKKKLPDEDKKRYYLYYIKNYSIMLDLEIILKALLKL
ncbi:glycosyltransferase [candidate division KSB1 bacterium]|nr:glycosyltransferase [candidate division KSB1 bacterium]